MDSLIHWLPADDNYSLNNSEKLLQPTEMDLSQNSKGSFEFFAAYLRPMSNFELSARSRDS